MVRHFKVYVADRETGKESVLFIEATGQQDAMTRAGDQGWLVSTAVELPPGLSDGSEGASAAQPPGSITAAGKARSKVKNELTAAILEANKIERDIQSKRTVLWLAIAIGVAVAVVAFLKVTGISDEMYKDSAPIVR